MAPLNSTEHKYLYGNWCNTTKNCISNNICTQPGRVITTCAKEMKSVKAIQPRLFLWSRLTVHSTQRVHAMMWWLRCAHYHKLISLSTKCWLPNFKDYYSGAPQWGHFWDQRVWLFRCPQFRGVEKPRITHSGYLETWWSVLIKWVSSLLGVHIE